MKIFRSLRRRILAASASRSNGGALSKSVGCEGIYQVALLRRHSVNGTKRRTIEGRQMNSLGTLETSYMTKAL